MMFTDSKSLFDTITKSSTTAEKRLMIDVAALREAYRRKEISDIGFVRTEFNPADAFTKRGKCRALDHLIKKGKCDFPIEQWIIRKEVDVSDENHDVASEKEGV